MAAETSADAKVPVALALAKLGIVFGWRSLQQYQAWLPDVYSQIFRSYVFGPSGFWTMARSATLLRC